MFFLLLTLSLQRGYPAVLVDGIELIPKKEVCETYRQMHIASTCPQGDGITSDGGELFKMEEEEEKDTRKDAKKKNKEERRLEGTQQIHEKSYLPSLLFTAK